MGALTIADYLREYAAAVPADRAIVEIGAWLGAGTRVMAEVAQAPIYVYDKFLATDSEVEKAAAFGVTLQAGQNTQSLVEKHLEGLDVRLHRGSIFKMKYDGPPIGLYVDDASKQRWPILENRLSPFFTPDTVMVMMDFYYPPCQPQRDALARHRILVDNIPNTSTRILQWTP